MKITMKDLMNEKTKTVDISKYIKTKFADWSSVALMRTNQGKNYFIGFANGSFPSSNNDEILFRITNVGRWSTKKIKEYLEEVGLDNKIEIDVM